MREKIKLSKSIVGQAETDAVARVIANQYLGMGEEVKLFESELAAFLEIPESNICCVNTGTAALHLAIEGCVSQGDEVLVPSLTYVASFQAVSAARAVPIACDVELTTLSIDLGDAERKLSEKTRAILPVHYAGQAGNLDDIYSFASKHGLRVIEDAAHAFGCNKYGHLIGSSGDVICFSFDGIKNITSGEGGAIVSSDQVLMSRVRDARLLGVKKDTDRRYGGQRSWDFDVDIQGYRYHMSNIMAAIGRTQLARFKHELAPKRRALANRYFSGLAGLKDVILPLINLEEVIPHIFYIRVPAMHRDGLRHFLDKQNIETGVHYKPNHYLSKYHQNGDTLPNVERLYTELLSLPLHPDLQYEDVDLVCELIKIFLRDIEK